jgi:transposase
VAGDPRCPDCGKDGRYRDTVTRPLTDLPVVGYPLVLQVAVPRYRCTTPAYGRAVSNQDVGKLAAPRASTTRHCARYVLRRLMIDRTTISAIAAELGVSWHTVGSIAMRATSGLIAAYADPNRRRGTKAMTRLIESIRRGVPAGLEELAQLGRTPSRRRADILAFFDHHASNGPTEAINGRLEALRRNALGFRNLTNYCRRSLLHSGALHSLAKAL